MSEFKGTKGLKILSSNEIGFGLGLDNNSYKLTVWGDDDEAKANTLIISKAPEMLEMIIELINEFDLHGDENEVIINKAKKIVKEATELN